MILARSPRRISGRVLKSHSLNAVAQPGFDHRRILDNKYLFKYEIGEPWPFPGMLIIFEAYSLNELPWVRCTANKAPCRRTLSV